MDASGAKPLVFFNNVDFLQNATLRPQIPAPAENITAWTAIELTLYVPSNFARTVGGITYDGVAGTGFLTVSNANGTSANSPQLLTIFRSEFTADGIPGSPSYRQLRYVGPSSRQGYEFNYDPAYYATPVAVRGAQQAMRRWRRKTRLNIGDQTDAGITASPNDAVCNIYFTPPLLTGPNYMQTVVSARLCTDTRTNGQFLYIVGIDIEVNPTPREPWSYDTLRAVPAGGRDFYSAILHEMGHAAGLTHVADAGKVMYPVTPAVGTSRRLLSAEPELNGVANFFSRSTTAYACQSSQPAYPPLMAPIVDPAQQLGAQMDVRTVLRQASTNCYKNAYDAFDSNTVSGVTYNWLPAGAYTQLSTTSLASFLGLDTQRWVYGSRFGLGDVGLPAYSRFCADNRVAATAPRTIAYPNPSTGDITISYDPTPGTRQVRLVLHNAQGVAVRSYEFAAGDQRTQLQLTGLKTGIYLLRTTEDEHAQPAVHLEVQ